MALILEDYDLSGGAQDSSEVASPNNWVVTATTTECGSRDFNCVSLWVEDTEGNWTLLLDDDDKAFSMQLKGNETKRLNAFGVNANAGLARVVPVAGSGVGTINIDSTNA